MWLTTLARKQVGSRSIAIAGSYCGMARVLIVSLPGTLAKVPRPCRHVFDTSGARGTFPSRIRHTEGHWTPVRDEALRDNATVDRVKTSQACTLTAAMSVVLVTQVPKTTGFVARKTCAHFQPPQPNGGKQVGRVGPSQAPAHTIAGATPADPQPPFLHHIRDIIFRTLQQIPGLSWCRGLADTPPPHRPASLRLLRQIP